MKIPVFVLLPCSLGLALLCANPLSAQNPSAAPDASAPYRNPKLTVDERVADLLPRLTLEPAKPSIYGSLRAEPRREYVSTLESVAAALTLCGESPEIEIGLSRVFRTLVQRVRDAHIIPPAARRSRGKGRAPSPPRAPQARAPKSRP